MARFPLHTIETAPAAARPVLQRLVEGSPEPKAILNLWAAMAESALTLETYVAMRRAVEQHSTLDARMRSAISIAVGGAIGGRYSPAVNARIAMRAGWSRDEIEAFRRGGTRDARLDAVLTVAREAATGVGQVSDATWSAALAAGWTPAELAEVFTIVLLVTFVDGFAAFADLELDDAFRAAFAA
jgi:alkylhydroperoxidase/carboxymuconolactone decarboxylase family protein YurZ